MKIIGVRSTIVAMSRKRPLKTVYGVMPKTTTVVVEVDTDEGIVGAGQTVAPAPWYGDSAEGIKVGIDKYIAPAIRGGNPFEIERLYDAMYRSLRAGRYAITAVEMALWDLQGKALGVPLYQLLGGKCNSGAPLHAFVERAPVEETAERIEQLSEHGWNWFKTKIGFGIDEDLRWYEQIVSHVGENARFQLDGNAGYTLGEAVQTLVQMEDLGAVALFEQPVSYLDEMAHLVTRLRTPVQADESVTSPRSVYEIAERKAAHVLHFKIQKFGGLLQAKRMAAVAEAAGLEISVAPYFDVVAAAAAHFASSTPNVAWPAGASDMEDTVLAEPLVPQGQFMVPTDGPGLGIELDQDKLAFYSAKNAAF